MIKYFVNEEKKYVIAKLENTREDAYKFLFEHFPLIVYNDVCGYPEFYMRNSYSVTVKCDSEDTFNVEEGKRIAKERLLNKYYRQKDYIIYNALKRYSDHIDEMVKYRDLAFKNYENSKANRK